MRQVLGLSLAWVVVTIGAVGCGGSDPSKPVIVDTRKPEPIEPPTPAGPDDPAWDKTLSPERYTNEEFRFSLRFPKEFERSTKPQKPDTLVTYTSLLGDNILLKCPENPAGDSLNIVFENLKKAAEGELGPKGKIVGTGDITAGGRPAKWISLSDEKNDWPTCQKVYVVRHRGRLLMLFCTAGATELGWYEAAFDDCAKSIRFE